jgi:NAD(P)-dependent dehydrogenase (short-subunit alcohol dehydrogenase family)
VRGSRRVNDTPETSVAGKTIVLTGASAGIGAAAARELHRLGARVVPIGRSAERTGALASELGVPPLVADFARLDDVRRVADRLLAQYPRIDVLANNAGGAWRRRTITVDGFEQTFQVNVLAPYLLMRLLADRLRERNGRVITTSSRAHTTGHLDLRRVTNPRAFSWRSYSTSKLAIMLLDREYARRYPDIGVADFHPGVVATEFWRDLAPIRLLLKTPLHYVLATSEQGADTLVYLAGTSEPLHGGYYVNRRRVRESAAARDPVTGARLWDVCADLVGLPREVERPPLGQPLRADG